MVTRAEVVSTARELVQARTPWVHEGRTVHGVDCIGAILYTARKLKITEYEPPAYNRRAEWGKFIGFFRQNLDEIKLKDIQPADILCFRQLVYPCHCAILTEGAPDPKFIHSYLLRKRVVEERYTAEWKRVNIAAFRFPNIED